MRITPVTSESGPRTRHTSAVRVAECCLGLTSGCQLAAQVSRSLGHTRGGPDIAHTSAADHWLVAQSPCISVGSISSTRALHAPISHGRSLNVASVMLQPSPRPL